MNKKIIAGVDEVGRGPLAGPVCAAVVVLAEPIEGLTDSKLLSEKKREHYYDLIMEQAVSAGIAFASVNEIDEINILQASLLAMQRACAQLTVKPDEVWVDGKHAPWLDYPTYTMIEGDKHMPEISAASIIAKVNRDRLMKKLAQEYPGYELERNKGYGTRAHLEGLKALGPTPIHRRSFAPVKALIEV